jgi:hypothetical protein
MLTHNKQQDNISVLNKKYNLIQSAIDKTSQSNTTILIANLCNNMNTFGAGFNKKIADKFIAVKENYHMLGPTYIKNHVGHVQFVPVYRNEKHRNEIVVANMICQTGIISQTNTRPLNYYYLGICLAKLQYYVKQYKAEKELPVEIFFPKTQNKITGANWSFVYDMIKDTLRKPTFTYVYE